MFPNPQGAYKIILLGIKDGSYDLRVRIILGLEIISDERFSGTIHAAETVVLEYEYETSATYLPVLIRE